MSSQDAKLIRAVFESYAYVADPRRTTSLSCWGSTSMISGVLRVMVRPAVAPTKTNAASRPYWVA